MILLVSGKPANGNVGKELFFCQKAKIYVMIFCMNLSEDISNFSCIDNRYVQVQTYNLKSQKIT